MRFTKPRPPKNHKELGILFALRQYLSWLDSSKELEGRFKRDFKDFKKVDMILLKGDAFDALKAFFEYFFIPFNEMTWGVIVDFMASGKKALDRKVKITFKNSFEADGPSGELTYMDYLPRITIDIYGKLTKKEYDDLWYQIIGERRWSPSKNGNQLPSIGMEKLFFEEDDKFNKTMGKRIDALLLGHRMVLDGSTYAEVAEAVKSLGQKWSEDTFRKDYKRFREVLDVLS